jgi:hypothetical protein
MAKGYLMMNASTYLGKCHFVCLKNTSTTAAVEGLEAKKL